MRLLFTFFLCLVAVLSGRAQERVRNVRIRVTDSAQLEIWYDLMSTQPGDSVYFEIRSRLRGFVRILPEFVRGDVGVRVSAGTDRRIIWNAVANGYPLNEEIRAQVFVKAGQRPATTASARSAASRPPAATSPIKKTKRVRPSVFAVDSVASEPAPIVASSPVPAQTASPVQPTSPKPDPAPAGLPASRTHRYAGPAWALVSVVAPGIGNIFVQTPKPKIGLRPLVTVGCYGLLVYGFLERQQAQENYDLYELQKNREAGDPYYQMANDHHHRYFMATRGALAVAAADVVLTFIKGLRNSQLRKEARRYQSVTISPGFQAGLPTAMMRYSF